MRTLVVDTTRDALFMALADGGRTVARCLSSRRYGGRQDERLLPTLRRLLGKSGWSLKDLEAVTAVSGPGRFTGIRIGLTFASMLSRSLGCRAAEVSRFEALARGLGGQARGKVCIALPASLPPQEEFYFQVFRRRTRGWVPAGEPCWAKPSDLKAALEGPLAEGLLFHGPAASEAARACGLGEARVLPGGREGGAALAACAEDAAKSAAGGARARPLRPLYLKPWRGQKPAKDA